LREPPKDQLIYTRHNGNFLLEITAHPRFGLPYGQDRLITIWLATLALQQKSPTLHFDSPSQLLDYFRLRKDGSQYRRMKAAFQRVFASTIFFGTEDQLKKHLVVDWTRFHFFDELQLWFNREDSVQLPAQETPCNVVVLSDAFYRELVGHPIPAERDVVCSLGPRARADGLLHLDHLEELDHKRPARPCSALRPPRPHQPARYQAIFSREALPAQDQPLARSRQAALARMSCFHFR
jgi:Plasmid encoded RepA protein